MRVFPSKVKYTYSSIRNLSHSFFWNKKKDSGRGKVASTTTLFKVISKLVEIEKNFINYETEHYSGITDTVCLLATPAIDLFWLYKSHRQF